MRLFQKGDKAAVIAPSDCIEQGSESVGVLYLKSLGLDPVLSKHLHFDRRFEDTTKQQIAKELMSFFQDPEIKVLFCTRGGSGSLKLLDYLDFDIIKKNPKPVFGFSDTTVLQNALYAKAGLKSYSGFLLNYDFKDGIFEGLTRKSFEQILLERNEPFKGGKTLREGVAEGVLIGGNLSALMQLSGTPYFPDLDGKILVLEDCGEKTYKIDTMLFHLKMLKNFEKLRGIILGQFTNCPLTDPYDGTIDEILGEFTKKLNCPVLTNFPYGHIKERYILPIGEKVVLNTTDQTLKTAPTEFFENSKNLSD